MLSDEKKVMCPGFIKLRIMVIDEYSKHNHEQKRKTTMFQGVEITEEENEVILMLYEERKTMTSIVIRVNRCGSAARKDMAQGNPGDGLRGRVPKQKSISDRFGFAEQNSHKRIHSHAAHRFLSTDGHGVKRAEVIVCRNPPLAML